MGEQFDAVFDTVGKTEIAKTIQVIKPNGRYLHAVTTPMTELKIRLNLWGTDIKLVGGTYSGTVEQIECIKKISRNERERSFQFLEP